MRYKVKLLPVLFLIMMQSVSCNDHVAGELQGAMSIVNITPPVGGRLAGHFYEILSTGIHDSLWAKSMVLEQDGQKFAFVFCDLIGLTSQISDSARKGASEQTGIPVKNIMISAAHSHTGPLFYGFQHTYFHRQALLDSGQDIHEKTDYPKFLVQQIIKAIVVADRSLQPVDLQKAQATEPGLSFNRRYYMKKGPVLFNPGPLNPEILAPAGPIDSTVGILLMGSRKSGGYIGGLTVFAMHADCIGGTQISADYPYYLEQTLKSKFGQGYVSAFGLGTCGDINDIDVKKDQPIYSEENTKKIGEQLGKDVISSLALIKPVSHPSLAMLSKKILLPLQIPSQEQIDSARELINNLYKVSKTGAYLKTAGGESGDFLRRVKMSKYLSLENRKDSVQVEVQAFRIDSNTVIVGLPGELFVELGLSIKKSSPFKNTIVMTVCNDKTSYIPTKKAYAEGSYEVTNSILMPGSGEMLVKTALQLLSQLKNNTNH